MKFSYDYTKTMMMKLKMADPDRKGGSIIYCNAEKALEIIKGVDKITLGIKKIIYLVGWQYLGHDDKYPAFFDVNKGIKRPDDKTAYDSLIWLMNEAKKYNTVVSVHINFTDAYADSPLFDEYVKANALIRTASGKPAKIEKYNGKVCYKISYKEEWESGLFKKRVDKFLSLFPIEMAGTVHVDNFQCYVNRAPFVSAEEMQYYRNLMIDYLREKGIDITSEFTYREGKGSVLLYGRITRDITPTRYPIALLNRIPAVWWADKMTIEEYFAYYPHVWGGGLPKNEKARNMFYGNIHGEDAFLRDNWQEQFIREFCMINLPFFYLNAKKRVGFTDSRRSAVKYSDGTVSSADGTIKSGGMKVKDKNSVFLPYLDGYVVFNEKGGIVKGKVDGDKFTLSEITVNGLIEIKQINAKNQIVTVDAKPNTAYFIKAC